MAIDPWRASLVAEHQSSLEATLKSELSADRRVRRAFKTIPLKPGIGVTPVPTTVVPTTEFSVQPRTETVASLVTKRSDPIPLTEIPGGGTQLIRDTLHAEDRYLFELLAREGQQSPPGYRRGRDWVAVVGDQRRTVPHVLLDATGAPADDAQLAALGKLNISVIDVEIDREPHAPRIAGLLLALHSDDALLRVEKEWRMFWDDAPGDGTQANLSLVMCARWHASVAPHTVVVILEGSGRPTQRPASPKRHAASGAWRPIGAVVDRLTTRRHG